MIFTYIYRHMNDIVLFFPFYINTTFQLFASIQALKFAFGVYLLE